MSTETPETAPVQGGDRGGTIPWALHVRIWQAYAALGHGSQSARRIAERGGFGWQEATWMLAEWNPLTQEPFTEPQRQKYAALRAALLEELVGWPPAPANQQGRDSR